jgi:hypothetical protein
METNKFKLIVIKQSLFKISHLLLLLTDELTKYKECNKNFQQDIVNIQELFYRLNIKLNN